MTTLATVNWGTLPPIPVGVAYEARRSGTTMLYKVYITIEPMAGSSYFGYPIYADLSLDGHKALGGIVLKAAQPSVWSRDILYESGWLPVEGKEEGTVTLSLRLYSGSGSTREDTYRYLMSVLSPEEPAAPRETVYSLQIPPLNVGQSHEIVFTHGKSAQLRLTYALGSLSGEAVLETVRTGEDQTVYRWLVPLSLAGAMADVTSRSGTVTMAAYRSGQCVKTREYPVAFLIPEEIVPEATLTVSLHNDNSTAEEWGLCIKEMSRLSYQVSAQGGAGATVAQCRFFLGDQVLTGLTGSLPVRWAGTLTPRAVVTDSRGRSITVTAPQVQSWDYYAPSIRSAFAWRCDDQGVETDSGAYLRVQMSGDCAPVGGRNTMTMKARFRRTGKSWNSRKTVAAEGSTLLSSALNAKYTYEVELSVTDTLGSSKSVVLTAASAAVTLHLKEGGAGAAFGKYAENDGLSCAWDAAFDGDVSVAGELNVGGQPLRDLLYPVGSVYISTSSTEPSTLFGGTWQALENRFLMAAGSAYPAGEEGGQATHTIALSELPAHTHGFSGTTGTESRSHTHGFTAVQRNTALTTLGSGNFGYESASEDTEEENQSHTHSFSGTTASAGSGSPMALLPPYLAVYMWERIS